MKRERGRVALKDMTKRDKDIEQCCNHVYVGVVLLKFLGVEKNLRFGTLYLISTAKLWCLSVYWGLSG